jgi:SWI/SNF-related matrix-associated actin-dependent regulator 1 of chromatin subfamily A
MTRLQKTLYPYQKRDVEWLLERRRCINGNPMGLGKTIETLAVLEKLKPRHCLIVCKKPFVGEWFWEIRNWLGEDCLTPHGGQGDRLDGLDLSAPKYVCVNRDLIGITRYWRILRREWDVLVIDEAHGFKNPKSARTKNAFLLSPYVDKMQLLTGSPMQGSPLDLYPLFRLMNPRDYHNQGAWVNYFCMQEEVEIHMRTPDGKSRPRKIKQIVQGETNHTTELNYLLHKYMLRHEKSEVMPDLPPKRYRKIPITLDTELRPYMQMQEEFFTLLDSGEKIESPKVITQMLRLRQICLEPNLLSNTPTNTPSSKTRVLMELLEDIEEKILVFSFFEQYVRLLCKMFDEAKIPYTAITGKNKDFDNVRNAHRFQDDPNVKICIGTIGAMGESFTLNAAGVVIFTDRFYNPAINDQCEDRAYGRVNKGLEQTESILVIDLVCEGTIEDHVHAVTAHKQKMIDEVVVRKQVIERMRECRGQI